jgi:Rrf2 family protein
MVGTLAQVATVCLVGRSVIGVERSQVAAGQTRAVHISAKADYAVRAAIHLASVSEGPTKGESVARDQGIPAKFLEAILTSLRRAGIVRAQRGAHGGYWLGRPATEITVADVIRAVEGPLASVRGLPPEEVAYAGTAAPLQLVWIAVRTNLREVLEQVTLADLAQGELPPGVREKAAEESSWHTR